MITIWGTCPEVGDITKAIVTQLPTKEYNLLHEQPESFGWSEVGQRGQLERREVNILHLEAKVGGKLERSEENPILSQNLFSTLQN